MNESGELYVCVNRRSLEERSDVLDGFESVEDVVTKGCDLLLLLLLVGNLVLKIRISKVYETTKISTIDGSTGWMLLTMSCCRPVGCNAETSSFLDQRFR